MGDEDWGTPAAPPSDQQDTPGEICESCGMLIDTSDWYPVTKERNADGSLQFYSFCSEDCQDAWAEEHRD